MKEKFDVTGMTCSACSSHVEKSVSKVDGVTKVSVNLLTNSMQVEYEEDKTNADNIIEAVENAGYGASVQNMRENSKNSDTGSNSASGRREKDAIANEKKNMKMRLIVSVVCLIPLMYVSMGHMIYNALNLPMPAFDEKFIHGNSNAITHAFTQFLLLLPILAVNKKYFINGFKTLKNKSPNMDSLIAIGASAAILYGIYAIYRIGYGLGYGDMELVMKYNHDLYFESAGTILTLITVGKYLESRSKGRTSEAITKLIDMAPKKATVIRDGKEMVIAAADIVKDDIFIVKPGEAAPVDGIITEGKSSFDESAVTGESIPVLKSEGDNIISATINKSGLIKAKATRVGEDTTISQIIKLVEEASQSKAPIAKLADKIAGVFVPVVITIALITGIIWLISGATFEFAMSSAIAVLVISCPCALGLATPVAIMVGTGKGAENGILIKSGEALETAHLTDVVVMDKTGTITKGKPVVTDITADGMSDRELLYIAGTLEKGSEHPLSEAIVNWCGDNSIELSNVKEFAAVFGRGISGKVDGKQYYAGNVRYMEELKVHLKDSIKNVADRYSRNGKTPLIFADTDKVIGIIAVADVVKESSKAAIKEFKNMGIEVVMLTGDNEVTANAIKEQVGIDKVIAGVLPDEKEAEIAKLKAAGHCVAMIGDGVNDAPALASADTGIAIGAGTDVAIESADIVLMHSDLYDAVNAVRLSKAVIKNIKENLFWAFFYNSIGIPVAAGVLYPAFEIKLNPMIGAAAMSLSSICVVSNALRLRHLKFKNNKTNNNRTNNSTEQKDNKKISNNESFKACNNTVSNNGLCDISKKTAGEIDNDYITSTSKRECAVKKEEVDNMKTFTISIEGMMCGHCTGRVEKALKGVAGVSEVTVSLENKNAVVKASDEVTADTLRDVVANEGYEVVNVE